MSSQTASLFCMFPIVSSEEEYFVCRRELFSKATVSFDRKQYYTERREYISKARAIINTAVYCDIFVHYFTRGTYS